MIIDTIYNKKIYNNLTHYNLTSENVDKYLEMVSHDVQFNY